jgi:hypothetical protein
MQPTGVQYLVFNAFEVAGIALRNWWDSDNGIWYVWILSPLWSVIAIHADGQVIPLRPGDNDDG